MIYNNNNINDLFEFLETQKEDKEINFIINKEIYYKIKEHSFIYENNFLIKEQEYNTHLFKNSLKIILEKITDQNYYKIIDNIDYQLNNFNQLKLETTVNFYYQYEKYIDNKIKNILKDQFDINKYNKYSGYSIYHYDYNQDDENNQDDYILYNHDSFESEEQE